MCFKFANKIAIIDIDTLAIKLPVYEFTNSVTSLVKNNVINIQIRKGK